MSESPSGAEEKPEISGAAQFYVMPERFLPLTRSGSLPAAPAASVSRAAEPPSAPSPPVPPVPTGGDVATPPPAPGSPETPLAPAPDPDDRRRKWLLGGGIAALVLLAAGITSYFLLRSVPPPPPPVPAPRVPAPTTPPQPQPAPTVTPPRPSIDGPVPPSVPVIIPTPEPPPAPLVNASPPLPSDDVDVDGDRMSEAEERVFGTDPTRRDTDGDGYADTLELLNLYNPTGTAPERLIDAGLVYEYEHPTDHWSVYVPKGWRVTAGGAVGTWEIRDAVGVVVVEIEVLGNPTRVAVNSWIRKQTQATDASVVPVSTRRAASGYQLTEADGSAYFALSATRILRLHAGGASLSYPNLFPLVLQSLRITRVR
ncbi:hypothetical protein HY632_00940 [Candidatus Uhrbacteria bacterium]|nr:hypothetical protein [Candidatus Uhrbacteria bacterium]